MIGISIVVHNYFLCTLNSISHSFRQFGPLFVEFIPILNPYKYILNIL